MAKFFFYENTEYRRQNTEENTENRIRDREVGEVSACDDYKYYFENVPSPKPPVFRTLYSILYPVFCILCSGIRLLRKFAVR